ncbi:MAG: flagellar hook-length control protein [Mycobacterium sp.]|nr:flagellar hook-length control protein [Mycobacterium sp.]
MTTAEDVIRAAASVGRDVAEGRMEPAALDAAVVDECRQLVGQVVGEGDPLFALQCEIARGVLAVGGIAADELSEWAAVGRQRAAQRCEPPSPSEELPEANSPASEPHSLISGTDHLPA